MSKQPSFVTHSADEGAKRDAIANRVDIINNSWIDNPQLRKLVVPPIAKDMLDMPTEDGISYNEAKRAIEKLSGVPGQFKGNKRANHQP